MPPVTICPPAFAYGYRPNERDLTESERWELWDEYQENKGRLFALLPSAREECTPQPRQTEPFYE